MGFGVSRLRPDETAKGQLCKVYHAWASDPVVYVWSGQGFACYIPISASRLHHYRLFRSCRGRHSPVPETLVLYVWRPDGPGRLDIVQIYRDSSSLLFAPMPPPDRSLEGGLCARTQCSKTLSNRPLRRLKAIKIFFMTISGSICPDEGLFHYAS
ncbi:unnamed protein product [Protopolystoma xenopodis]|uniref:Uncharacterized protein n=1 Tax=Protopolystoma xenopodis TaxID=117903 RepID=A0A3S5CP51_9PLAT|nr:unnamed protein product [Protopolystoma xenopodis]